MRQVQLHEEEEQFAALVAQAEAGESLTILKGGRPVAQIIPFPRSRQENETEEQRLAAVETVKAMMARGVDLGVKWNGRDELYDRD